jgi:superfamily I DNA/RNA helicase
MNKKEFELLLKKQEIGRKVSTKKIIDSTCPRKVIVSGPGTGKTFTFKEVLKTKSGDCLALTFINNLARKLEEELGDLAKVCTFHSFCKEILHKIPKEDLSDHFILFPHLEAVIRSDMLILFNEKRSFSRSFHKIDLPDNSIEFFIHRSSYYDAVSFDDSVYRVMEYFKYHPDQIPKYEQVVVDEYQDFNKLEVEFLDMLAEKSPMLVVGDDDQALYGMLKSASADYIREKFNDPEYEHFCLPFCSRCPAVITHAIEDILVEARKRGKLSKRINKIYKCYLPDKWRDSQKYPKITYVQCSTQSKKTPYIAKFIEKEIDKLTPGEIRAANDRGDYTVLIAGSGHYLKQVQVYFKNAEKYKLFLRKDSRHTESFKLIDGYKILLKNGENSNLGWRILLEFDKVKNLKTLLKKTNNDPSLLLINLLDSSYVRKHKTVLVILRGFFEYGEISSEQQKIIQNALGEPIEKIKEALEEDDAEKDYDSEELSEDDVSIVFSTYVGCKGLSAGYVFIIGMDEQSLPRRNVSPTDIEICNFIVALTRTIKKCYLISTFRFSGKSRKPSIFIDWIRDKRLENIEVKKAYFEVK